MAGSEIAWHLGRFPAALGALLAAPRRALAAIEAAERGGVSVVVVFLLASAVSLRFVGLAEAFAGLDAGGLARLGGVVGGEIVDALPAVIGAALAVVVLAGRRRDPLLDLELGAAAAIPFLVTRALARAAALVAGRALASPLVRASYAVGLAWTALLVVFAVAIARRRRGDARAAAPPAGSAPAADARPRAPGGARAWAAGAAALAVLAIALASGARYAARHADSLGPIARGSAAPDFTLARVDGTPGEVSLAPLRGRVVLLDFWATWCPPCVGMLPTLHELHAEYAPRGVAFVGVDSDGDQATPAEVSRFLAAHGAPYPVVYDDGSANARYRVTMLPTLIVVGSDGAIARVLVGATSKRTLAGALDAALARL